MLLTALTLMLTTADVQDATGPSEVQPKWAVNYVLTSPAVIGASISLSPPAGGGLGSVTRPGMINALSLERALGAHLTGLVTLTLAYSQFAQSSSFLTGGALLGVHWYQSRPLDGFWVGPEVLFLLAANQVPDGFPLAAAQTKAIGVRARVGWTQRFGAHFFVSASTGVGGNVSWSTGISAETTLNLFIDGTLGAGLMF